MKVRFLSFVLSLTVSLVGPASAGLLEALEAAREGDWPQARSEIAGQGETAEAILTWYRLRNGLGTFDEYLEFLDTRSHWPGLTQIRRLGERTIDAQTPRADVLSYFRNRHAGTPHGALHFADALNAAGQTERARREIVFAWRYLSFSRSEQAIYLKEFESLIAPHNFVRLDRLLWRGQVDQAERMYPFLSKEERALARARVTLREKANGVDAAISAVPEVFKDDAGLAFERFLWRYEKGRRDGAQALMLDRSGNPASLGRPAYWSSTRRVLARDAMRSGRDETAYDLAANHHLTSGNDFADLEWLAGYIALTRLEDPNRALKHFRRFRAGVDSPISIGRGAYWEARAYEALDRPDDAKIALEYAAEFQTGFYGLLAAEEANVPMNPEIFDRQAVPFAGAEFLKSDLLLAGMMLAQAGEKSLASFFFGELFDRISATDQVKLGDLALAVDEPHLAVAVAKLSASRGDVLPRPYFPIVEVDGGDVPPELILSIIRRESEFNTNAQSRAGARGLMQLMPATAKEVSRDLGEAYDIDALIADPDYNKRLGTEYLRFLREEFGDNVLLVSSAYNAGPGRTGEWLRRFGDPRGGGRDAIEWIESIPFRETRNYVMRVAESVVIYRARLAGESQPIRISQELKAR